MRAAFRVHAGFSAVMLLLATSLVAQLPRCEAGEEWYAEANEASINDKDPTDLPEWFTIRVNALYLNRRPNPSNIVLTESATGNELLNTSDTDPSWAGGTEVDFLLSLSETLQFEFDWFSVDDWFDWNPVNFSGITVDEVPFPVTFASVSVSSRIRNMEFNLRDKFTDNLTLLAGFRYVEFLDAQGVHYRNEPFGNDEVITTQVANRMYGVQAGAEYDFWKTEKWEIDAWAKVGVYGNAMSNSTGIISTIPGNASNIRAQDGRPAFVGDMAIRGSRKFGDFFSVFIGYRLMYLDGIALAANQYQGTINYLNTAIPSIEVGNSMFLQGIEAGLSISF